MADQCSICLDALDGGVAALACGHRFHVACLASMAGAVGTASSTSRRGTRRRVLTVAPLSRGARESAAFSASVIALPVGPAVPGVVDECSMAAVRTKSRGTTATRVRCPPPTSGPRSSRSTSTRRRRGRTHSRRAVVTPRAATPVEPLPPARPPIYQSRKPIGDGRGAALRTLDHGLRGRGGAQARGGPGRGAIREA